MNIPAQFFINRYARIALILLVSTFATKFCIASDPAVGNSLEDYLKRLGYEAVDFKQTDHTQDFVEGVLSEDRTRVFLVDTGWGMTALSKAAAKGLKRLAEVPAYPGAKTTTDIEMVQIGKLTLDHVQLFSQPARVQDLSADYVHLPFDAVLGCD